MNCKPGDLAIVTSSEAGNEGLFVEVIEWIGCVDFYDGSDRWRVRSVGSPITNDLKINIDHLRDSQLRPVSGLPDTEDTDTEQPIKEVA
jgi:hypothetical protein